MLKLNSEKYIICKNYKGYNSDLSIYYVVDLKSFDIPISKDLLDEMMNVNKLYCNNQIKKIQEGIELIRSNVLIVNQVKIKLDYLMNGVKDTKSK